MFPATDGVYQAQLSTSEGKLSVPVTTQNDLVCHIISFDSSVGKTETERKIHIFNSASNILNTTSSSFSDYNPKQDTVQELP